MSSKGRGRSSSKDEKRRDPGQRSSRPAPQPVADFADGAAFASRRGGETGGPAGPADGIEGAADGDAGTATDGAGSGDAGGADRGADVGDGDGDAEGDGVTTGAVGSAATSLGRREICSLTKLLTEDIA